MKKIIYSIKKGLFWVASKYAALPIYLQWLALGVIATPAIASFLIIWFALNQMGEHSFGRWLLAVIPAFSMLMGIVIGMSHFATHPPKLEK